MHRRERRDDRKGHYPESGLSAIVSMANSGDRVGRGVVLDPTTDSGAKGIFDLSNSGRKTLNNYSGLLTDVSACQQAQKVRP